ncbi:MAG TPA: rod shape-determining protein MreD [Gammaproteobacteria bacterium]|jgi:rod shape-determining protein MreD|nr:rod shape-determining protein MreD [Gammaproteobacteria bacterium]
MISLFASRPKVWVIPATFLASYVLISFPVGLQWRGYAPDWVTLVLIYWCMAAPQRVGVGAAWLVGLGLDLLTFGLVGSHALTKTVIAFLVGRVALRLRVYPVWQQTAFILILLVVETAILVAIKYLVDGRLGGMVSWPALAVGVAVWPLLFWILRRCRRWGRLP